MSPVITKRKVRTGKAIERSNKINGQFVSVKTIL